jgi:hypothetical protein
LDINNGEIRQLSNDEQAVRTEVMLSHAEAAYLEMLAKAERPEEYKALHSHNNSKHRRAVRRMQNASRRRNRK